MLRRRHRLCRWMPRRRRRRRRRNRMARHRRRNRRRHRRRGVEVGLQPIATSQYSSTPSYHVFLNRV
jgi:hypothetical protein